MYTKECLERLKEKIDLIELVSSYVELKAAGASYKGLCPYHDEKSPSFTLRRGDTHYHCFGCGVHGDAIQFLMTHLNLSFQEAVESLAERFQVVLEVVDQKGPKVDLTPLKEALEVAQQFYHYCLLEDPRGKEARDYLLGRGLTVDFIRRFGVGFAPDEGALFRKVMRHHKVSEDSLHKAGLLTKRGSGFFRGRITFPIRSSFGQIVGFSARKLREESYGGKYINTPETALFKKSHLLFGLNYSRRRIAKEGVVILVEGQVDALRLIDAGLSYAVAALGTAFGKEHVGQLKKLGVKKSYLLFDGDKAGRAAASKVGDLLQEVGVDVVVACLPEGSDPDSYLAAHSVEKLCDHMERGQEYLEFQVAYLHKGDSPAAKTALVKRMQEQIERWQEPLMVHESLKKLAALVDVPQQMVRSNRPIVQKAPVKKGPIDFARILEMDFLRWLILKGNEKPELLATASSFLTEQHFFTPACKRMFCHIIENKQVDLLSCAMALGEEALIDEIMQKKVNVERVDKLFVETVQRLCDRLWLKESEEIKLQMQEKSHSEEEVFALAKRFDALKKNRPSVTLISCDNT